VTNSMARLWNWAPSINQPNPLGLKLQK